MTDQPQQMDPKQALDRAQVIIDRLRAKLTEANEHIVSLETDMVLTQRDSEQKDAVIQGMAAKIAELQGEAHTHDEPTSDTFAPEPDFS
jgi:hypothetical protein